MKKMSQHLKWTTPGYTTPTFIKSFKPQVSLFIFLLFLFLVCLLLCVVCCVLCVVCCVLCVVCCVLCVVCCVLCVVWLYVVCVLYDSLSLQQYHFDNMRQTTHVNLIYLTKGSHTTEVVFMPLSRWISDWNNSKIYKEKVNNNCFILIFFLS